VEELAAPDVYVKATGTPQGRGVFAARRFSEDEVVEVSPVVIVPVPRKHFRLNPRTTTFHPTPEVTVEVRFVREFKVLVFSLGDTSPRFLALAPSHSIMGVFTTRESSQPAF